MAGQGSGRERASGLVRRFGSDRSGVVAIIFGLAVLPLMIAVGATIDYSRASSAKTSLDVAADAAVMTAIRRSTVMNRGGDGGTGTGTTGNGGGGSGNGSGGNGNGGNGNAGGNGNGNGGGNNGSGGNGNGGGDRDLAVVKAGMEAQFRAAAVTSGITLLDEVTADVTESGGIRTARLVYKARVRTAMMGIAGFQHMTIGGDSVGNSGAPTFIDFYLLLDNTPSMGLGATTADIDALIAATKSRSEPDGCAFACHETNRSGNDSYALAKRLGVQLRIGVVRQAVEKVTEAAADAELVNGQFRTAIYTFGASCTDPRLTRVSPLTPNHATAKRDASHIDLMTIPYQNYNNDQCTDFDKVLADMDREISAPGIGRNHGTAQKVMFLVTDGVGDAYNPSNCSRPTTNGRCQEPMKIATCQALKARGVRVAVLHTSYLPLPSNDWYRTWIQPFERQVGPQLRDCASPGLYFEVTPSQGIPQAMTALFQRAVNQARLTN